MKLNKDFVRSLLLFVESNETLNGPSEQDLIDFATNEGLSKNDLVYTILRLLEAGFIKGDVQYASNEPYWLYISALTYDGHEFLENVRDSKVWRATKKASSKVGNVSLNILSTIAADIIKKVLSGEMSL